jgi:hypothetical protein
VTEFVQCVVCRTSRPDDAICPQCGWDDAAPDSRDPLAVTRARETFKASTLRYAPQERVTGRDKLRPWLGLGLGLVLLLVWLASCRILY